ncbi:MAG: AAA family ATPase [Nitrospirae bacterium]|nr:AAA family ATPase [Nitrospirota bacterium]
MEISPSINIVISLAMREAIYAQYSEIEPEHILIAILIISEYNDVEFEVMLNGHSLNQVGSEIKDIVSIFKKIGINSTNLRRQIREIMDLGGAKQHEDTMHRSQASKKIFSIAEDLCEKDNNIFAIKHLFFALLMNPTEILLDIIGDFQQNIMQNVLCEKIQNNHDKKDYSKDLDLCTEIELGIECPEIEDYDSKPVDVSNIVGLLKIIRSLRDKLRRNIFGQDNAIQSFIEGIFNSELLSKADDKRKRPKAVFVFAGPPGVGKTYLAERGAEILGIPFKRFDMSAYSDHQAGNGLIGFDESYKGSKPGVLTKFVYKNPFSMLLFDEIEKAHTNTIHLFLQILDAGVLEDKFTCNNVSFSNTIIIFTTNAGKILYESDNAFVANYHKKTILNALETEISPITEEPFFPPAICSRMAAGYPLMFNKLTIKELIKVVETEIERQGELLNTQFNLKLKYNMTFPICIVLREGARTDARTMRAATESYIKSEIYKFFQLFREERIGTIINRCDNVYFDMDPKLYFNEDMKAIFENTEKPNILLIADNNICSLWTRNIPGVNWKMSDDLFDILNILRNEYIDLVLIDMFFDSSFNYKLNINTTMAQFDNIPIASKNMSKALEILRNIYQKHQDIPCYLISLVVEKDEYPKIDDELFFSCIQAGGVRGILQTSFISNIVKGWETDCTELKTKLNDISTNIYLQKQCNQLSDERKVISFDTVPKVSEADRTIYFRLRNFRISRSMAAADVSEVLSEVERPVVKFSDIYGADTAKSELGYIVEWLRNPKKYKAIGLRNPKGILLYGHPGTGKTMLARALAGECSASFIVDSASTFVDLYVGAGSRHVRELFARARRYAPAVLFIDEIDAVGIKRTGWEGTLEYSNTLNAILTEMDGFDTNAQKPVIVIAATNLVEHLDDALRRRFDREIEVDKPDRNARKEYLKRRLQGVSGREVSDTVIDRLSEQTVNMTIAELERVVELAGRLAVKDEGVINDKTIEEAFENIRVGERSKILDGETLLRVARHEAGHCLIGWLCGVKPVQVTIIARGNAGGYFESNNDEDRVLYTQAQLEEIIRQSMAGRAAEIIYYGEQNGFSTGVSSDLKTATHYADLMVRQYGMSKEIGQITVPLQLNSNDNFSEKVLYAIERIINEQLNLAIKELSENKNYLDNLVEALREKNRLTLDDLEQILPPKT